MRVHARTRGYMRVHARTRGYTRVHVLTLNSMYLAHKWTEKWAKYATGEDAGSGAWTLGHAGSRGFAQVHARTRAYTRVHARTCPNAQFDAQMDRGSQDGQNTLQAKTRVRARGRSDMRVRAGACAYVS